MTTTARFNAASGVTAHSAEGEATPPPAGEAPPDAFTSERATAQDAGRQALQLMPPTANRHGGGRSGPLPRSVPPAPEHALETAAVVSETAAQPPAQATRLSQWSPVERQEAQAIISRWVGTMLPDISSSFAVELSLQLGATELWQDISSVARGVVDQADMPAIFGRLLMPHVSLGVLRDVDALLSRPGLRHTYERLHVIDFAVSLQGLNPASTLVSEVLDAGSEPRIFGDTDDIEDADPVRARELSHTLALQMQETSPDSGLPQANIAGLEREIRAYFRCSEMEQLLQIYTSAPHRALAAAQSKVYASRQWEDHIADLYDRMVSELPADIAAGLYDDDNGIPPTAREYVAEYVPKSEHFFSEAVAYIRQANLLAPEAEMDDPDVMYELPRHALVRMLPELLQASDKSAVAEIFENAGTKLQALCDAVQSQISAGHALGDIQDALHLHFRALPSPNPASWHEKIGDSVAQIATEAFSNRRQDIAHLLQAAVRPESA